MFKLPQYTESKNFERHIKRDIKAKLHKILVRGSMPFFKELDMELTNLGYTAQEVYGGFEIEGKIEDIYRINLFSSTASRVFLMAGRFHATAREQIFRRAVNIPWELYINPAIPIRIQTQLEKSPVSHEGEAERALRDAISKRFEPLLEDSDIRLSFATEDRTQIVQRILLIGIRNAAKVYIDTTGEHLAHRGYRTQHTGAPIKEHLAASCIIRLLKEEDMYPELPDRLFFLDPFCGSGTILAEAGIILTGDAPGKNRRNLFEKLPWHQEKTWEYLKQNIETRGLAATKIKLIGRDKDSDAVATAKANLTRAGLQDFSEINSANFFSTEKSDLVPTRRKAIFLSNLPYGERIPAGKELYDRILEHLAKKHHGLTGAFILPEDYNPKPVEGIITSKIGRFSNGGIRVQLLMVKSIF
ncbi:hypothetical protein WKV44_01855 [Spirochaetia bacterium 38H-sp]|uniref:N6-adenine-specific DNA methylase n=1 Tax=Rarispira pelagica TaxID=3141764 RepID=A0ABU9U9X2_9SPIR